MIFVSLGSGSSGNCYFLSSGGKSIIIDVGLGVRTLKKNAALMGVDLGEAVAILITHDHADHIKSVGSLCVDLQIPVYATERVHRGIEENYFVNQKIPSELRKELNPYDAFQICDFRITPFAVPHDSHDCVGFFIEVAEHNFCLLTDVGCISETIGTFISRANHLVIEANYDPEMLWTGRYPHYLKERITSGCGHLSNQQCAEAIATFATPLLKNVWLCHLSQENNHPELARKSVDSYLRSKGLCPGADFNFEVLKRKTPCGPYCL